MTTAEMKECINKAMFAAPTHGLSTYACVQSENDIILKKFQMTDDLRDSTIAMLNRIIKTSFLSDEAEVDSCENISDNRRVYYEISQTKEYAPFIFANQEDSLTNTYSEKDQPHLKGLLFKVNINENYIWIYQHIYQMHLVNRSKSLYAILAKGEVYKTLEQDVLKIDSRIDLIIIDNSIFTMNLNLMQNEFGFEKFVRSEAKKTIDIIDKLGIVSGVEKFISFEGKTKLTNAKKLLKAQKSPVLQMSKEDLIASLQKHHWYKDRFTISGEQIIIKSEKNAAEFIKMLNDDIVRSELTNKEYDSVNKKMLSA